ncbi:GNAT family N-acetyltransferase [Lentzea flava]|uniref:N-acetyltransferase domain-containing protein n=1 Tax=Lentzea flava TaxID=103732 RepID=A0ABQ2VH51_9PSEU|nr:GNAT family N-acetyltransferase [Lentzea flava]MCP2204772.1 hypothetical protein [Lentzea flava]GGU81489.1 hypothetical protein GCM10010178_85210 [Lentzea flava]
MQIVTATSSDAPAIGELIATSFRQLACSRWLVKSREDWERIGPLYFEREVRDAIANGVVYTVPDLSAALVAFDHVVEPESPPERESWLMEITGPYFERFARFEAAFAAAHPRKPHHYGAHIAVRSTERNKGVASLLLDHHHQVLDDLGRAVYAEASSKRLEHFFARHGYAPIGSPVVLDGEELLQPVWREARRPG